MILLLQQGGKRDQDLCAYLCPTGSGSIHFPSSLTHALALPSFKAVASGLNRPTALGKEASCETNAWRARAPLTACNSL